MPGNLVAIEMHQQDAGFSLLASGQGAKNLRSRAAVSDHTHCLFLGSQRLPVTLWSMIVSANACMRAKTSAN